MPVMTGIELIQRLARRSYLTTHPLIFYSGNLTPELEQQARHLGVYAVLPKPYSFKIFLIRSVKRVKIKKHEPLREVIKGLPHSANSRTFRLWWAAFED